MRGVYPHNRGDKSSAWKGDKASYFAKHLRAKTKWGQPMQCEECGEVFDSNNKIHWANISGKFKEERSDWRRLCVPCHRKFDYSRGAGHTRGETHLWAKLTETQVREIRSIFIPNKWGEYAKLARWFEVAPATIHLIIKRKNWKHI